MVVILCAFAVNQIELTPYLTFDEVVAYCQKEQIVLEAYCPLAKGFKLEDPLLISIAAKYEIICSLATPNIVPKHL